MSETMAPPQAQQLNMQMMQLVSGYWVTQMVGVAAHLGVADVLADGPLDADAIAQRVNAHGSSVYRLLRTLSTLGVFAEHEGRRFSLTPLAELLRTGVPGSLREMAMMNATPSHWLPWGELLHGVRTGGRPAEKALGLPNIFEYYRAHPDEAAIFNGAMTNLSANSVRAVVASYNFGGIKKLMDVGGGHGTLITAVLEANAGLEGVLVDLPEVVKGARNHARLETRSGDFFQALPAGADAIIMKHILHDWADEQAVQILKNCAAALPEGGRVLVVEALVEGFNEPSMAKMLDMNMFAATPGGRERTQDEFEDIFKRGGFRLGGLFRTPSPMVIVEGIKA